MLKLVGITATVKMPWESTAVAVIMTTGKGWLIFVGTRTVLKEVESPLHKNVYKLTTTTTLLNQIIIDDESDVNNYRPISLLSNFNRIFEEIMYKRMTSYIEQHDLLYPSQYGFRKGHSTQHAILDINDIQANMNQRLLSCGVFIDLKKAFDTVDHEILLNNLNHYGFRGIINEITWKSRVQSTRSTM